MILTAKMQLEVEKWKNRVGRLVPKPCFYSPGVLFGVFLPEKDFEFDGTGIADSRPYWCAKCNSWHLEAYGLVLSRKTGVRKIELYHSDCQGIYEIKSTWQDGDHHWLPFAKELEQLDTWRYWKGWMDYCLWVIQHNKDPLQRFDTTELNSVVDAFVENARAYYGLCFHRVFEKTGHCSICGASAINGALTCDHNIFKMVWV